jgi:hypothetical protein
MNICTNRAPHGGIPGRGLYLWHVSRIVTLLLSAASLTGCSLWVRTLNGNAQRLVSAEPLEVSIALTKPHDAKNVSYTELTTAETSNDDTKKKEYLGKVVMDSQAKCQKFINGLVIAQNTVNTTGDVTSAVLTGLASVFKPLTTVHALTAGSTVVTATKASVDANIYAKASIVNFQTALQQSYTKSMKDYTDALPRQTNVILSNEVSKIQSIHGTCTLAATEAAILATISPGSPPEKPAGLAATALNGGVRLTWTTVSGLTYNIFQGVKAGGEASTPIAAGITDSPYTVASLQNDTTYYFYIVAQNTAGSSPKSDEVSAKPSSSITETATATPPQPTHGVVAGQDLRGPSR